MKTFLFTLLLLGMTAAPAKADTTTIYFDSLDQPFQTVDMCIYDTLVLVNNSGYSYLLFDDNPGGTMHFPDSLENMWGDGAGYFWGFSSYCTDGEVNIYHQVFPLLFTIHFTLPETVIDTTICSGQSYLFDGIPRTTSGTYTSFSPTDPCGELFILNLTVTPPNTEMTNVQICPGETYLFAGNIYSEPGIYYDTLSYATGGCDSLVRELHLTFHQPVVETITVTICEGESYSFAGTAYSQAGTYYDTIPSAISSCDSLVKELELSLYPPVEISIHQVDTSLFVTFPLSMDIEWVDCANNYSPVGVSGYTYTPAQNGSYAAIGYENGCSDTSECITIDNLGMNDPSTDDVTVYPVPATDQVILSAEKLPAGSAFSLYDPSGKCVLSGKTDGPQTVVRLDKLAPGCYFIWIDGGEYPLKIERE